MRALVTGASRGIGRAIALEIAPDCRSLVLVSRTKDLMEQLQDEIKQKNPNCTVLIQDYDATDLETVQYYFAQIMEKLGGLDVLVNCAGKAIPPRAVQEISLKTWNEIFAVNATLPFLMTKAAIPAMRNSPSPAIVNIASTAGLTPRPGWSAYAASKASLVNFSETMAAELKPYGIKVHCVAPGRTATELRRILAPDEDPKTIMQPNAVARVVRFLITDQGHVLQGQAIVVRGD